jgi:hypothetical protein
MKNIIRTLTLALIVLGLGAVVSFAQPPKKAPAYKIAAITITPYDEASGKFEDPIGTGESARSLFNDLSLSLFVTVDVAGEAGSFETGRMINITVKEGKKIKTTRHLQVGLIGGDGHYYVPVWLYPAMCSDVTITASLTGQKTASSMKRTVIANCGE